MTGHHEAASSPSSHPSKQIFRQIYSAGLIYITRRATPPNPQPLKREPLSTSTVTIIVGQICPAPGRSMLTLIGQIALVEQIALVGQFAFVDCAAPSSFEHFRSILAVGTPDFVRRFPLY
ncbi:hypothetical protein Dimus_009067 [Dionaea muscipula]